MARLKLALDIGTYNTKLLVEKPHGQGMHIADCKIARTPAGSIQQGEIREPKALSDMLRELLKPYLSKGDVFCTLGTPALVFRQLILPWPKEKDFKALISLQLERMLSDSLKDYQIDYRVSRIFLKEDTEKAAVSVFAVPRRIIDGYIRLFDQTGISPNILDVQPNCVSKLFKLGHCIKNPSKESSYALIDMGYGMTGIHIIDHGSLAFSRVLATGVHALDQAIMEYYQVSESEAERLREIQADFQSDLPEILSLNHVIEAGLDPVMAEIQRVFRFYTVKNVKKALEKAFLYGGLSHLKNVDSYLSGILNCPVEFPESFPISPSNGPDNCGIRDYINCLGTLVREDLSSKKKRVGSSCMM